MAVHIGIAMAKLNPKNVRFDVGTGGKPELSSTDIAAAIAFVPDGLGRELLCHVWWPDGARLTAEALDQRIAILQIQEWTRREEAMRTAEAAYAVATTQHSKLRAQAMLEVAESRVWPSIIISPDPVKVRPTYRAIRLAVLDELAHGECEVCGGRGIVNNANKYVPCKTCTGSGEHRRSDRSRAASCGLESHSAYVRQWRKVYEWLLDVCIAELAPAEEAFRRALR